MKGFGEGHGLKVNLILTQNKWSTKVDEEIVNLILDKRDPEINGLQRLSLISYKKMNPRVYQSMGSK